MLLHMKNLPNEVESVDIRNFFQGLAIPNGGVHIASDDDAFIKFTSTQDILDASRLDGRRLLGHRVHLLLCTEEEKEDILQNIRKETEQREEEEERLRELYAQQERRRRKTQDLGESFYLALANVSRDATLQDVRALLRRIGSGVRDDGIVMATFRKPPVAFVRLFDERYYRMAMSVGTVEMNDCHVSINKCSMDDYESHSRMVQERSESRFESSQPKQRSPSPPPQSRREPERASSSALGLPENMIQSVRQLNAQLGQQQVLEALQSKLGPSAPVVFQGQKARQSSEADATKELLLRLHAQRQKHGSVLNPAPAPAPAPSPYSNTSVSSQPVPEQRPDPYQMGNSSMVNNYHRGTPAPSAGATRGNQVPDIKLFVKVDQLPSKADIKWVRWFLNDCVIKDNDISIVSFEGKALYAYVAVQNPIDVRKAVMKDSMRVGNDIISVSSISVKLVEGDLKNLPSSLSVECGKKVEPPKETAKPAAMSVNYIGFAPGDHMKVMRQNIEKPTYTPPPMPPRPIPIPPSAPDQAKMMNQYSKVKDPFRFQPGGDREKPTYTPPPMPPRPIPIPPSAPDQAKMMNQYSKVKDPFRFQPGGDREKVMDPFSKVKDPFAFQPAGGKKAKGNAMKHQQPCVTRFDNKRPLSKNQAGYEQRKKKVKFDESNVEKRQGSHTTKVDPKQLYSKIEAIQVEGLPLYKDTVQEEFLTWLKGNNVTVVGKLSFYKGTPTEGDEHSYYIGHVAANGHINPTLPRISVIAGYHCKISHNLQSVPHCHACRNFNCSSGKDCEAYDTRNESFLIDAKATPKLPPGDDSDPFMYQGHLYPSVLQALIAVMAQSMGHPDIAARMIVAQCKLRELLRKLDKYDSLNWEQDHLETLVDIYRAKYNQAPEFQRALIKTGTQTLVFLNMRSTLGVGMYLAKKDWLRFVKPAYFPGLNLAGRALMIVRQEKLGIPFTDYMPEGRTRFLPSKTLPYKAALAQAPLTLITPREGEFVEDVEMEVAKAQRSKTQSENGAKEPHTKQESQAKKRSPSPPPPPPPPPSAPSQPSKEEKPASADETEKPGKYYLQLEGLPIGNGITVKTVVNWLEAPPRNLKHVGTVKTWKRKQTQGQPHRVSLIKMEVEKPINPAMPRHLFINGHACKALHTLQAEACVACRMLNCDIATCQGFSDNTDVFALELNKTSVLSPNDLFCPFQYGGQKQFSVNLALMWKMSLELGYKDVADQIRTAVEPIKYGEMVKKLPSFECLSWELRSFHVLKDIYLAKWEAAPLFQKALQDTDSKIIVYQHSRATWGTGLPSHPYKTRVRPEYLPGLNFVGKALMQIRGEKHPELQPPAGSVHPHTVNPPLPNPGRSVPMEIPQESVTEAPVVGGELAPDETQGKEPEEPLPGLMDIKTDNCSKVKFPNLMAQTVEPVNEFTNNQESAPILQKPLS